MATWTEEGNSRKLNVKLCSVQMDTYDQDDSFNWYLSLMKYKKLSSKDITEAEIETIETVKAHLKAALAELEAIQPTPKEPQFKEFPEGGPWPNPYYYAENPTPKGKDK